MFAREYKRSTLKNYMNMNKDMNVWWSSLTIAQKERIACKIVDKKAVEWNDTITYPACTRLWSSLTPELQQRIHDHCTDAHGYLLKEWSEGKGMSY